MVGVTLQEQERDGCGRRRGIGYGCAALGEGVVDRAAEPDHSYLKSGHAAVCVRLWGCLDRAQAVRKM